MAIKALVFDAYGTLYDVHSVYKKTEELCPGHGDLITQIWRLKQLEYTWLQTSLQTYRDFTFLTRASLVFSLKAAGIEPTEAITETLFQKYLDLDPYPESREALEQLKNYKLAILTNGSQFMIDSLVKNSGFDTLLDASISVDGASKFKPHPAAYALVEQKFGVKPEEVLFVSSNGFDVTGAKAFGFRVAWIRRVPEGGAPAYPVAPAEMYRRLRSRPEELGFVADHEVNRLTDLPRLLA